MITNEELALTLDTSDEWVRQRTGISERHVVPPGESTSDLGIAAAKAALADARLDPCEIDMVITATVTPDPAISRGLPVHLDPELPLGPEFLRGIDLWSSWEAVRCPVLVLRGAESEVLPRQIVDEMQRRKPNLQIVEFAGVGHVPALASVDQIDVVRKFLNAPDSADEL